MAAQALAKRTSEEDFSALGELAEANGKAAGNVKKRPALGDRTNTAQASQAWPRGKAGETEADEDARAQAARKRAPDLSRPQSHVEASLTLEAARQQLLRQQHTFSRGSPDAEAMSVDAESSPSPQPRRWKDVDAQDAEDPLYCTAYVNDIYTNLRAAEMKHRPSTRYMDTLQRDINATMRGILVDWLVEVAEEYKLVPDTLFLSVAYIDRCLSLMPVVRAKLQLVGVGCMLIAAKYEEIYAPQVEEFCYITDNTYDRPQVLSMERQILDCLSFELTTPTTKSFLRRFLRAAEADQKTEFLASFLAELTLLEYSFLKYPPSMVAASAVFLALYTLNQPPWTATLEHYAQYTAQEIKACVTALHEVYVASRRSTTLPAIREKYSQHKFKCVSTIPPLEAPIPEHFFAETLL